MVRVWLRGNDERSEECGGEHGDHSAVDVSEGLEEDFAAVAVVEQR